MRQKKLNKEQIEFIKNNIDEFKSNKELGGHFNLSAKQISGILYHNKIRRSTNVSGKTKVNEDFFNEYTPLSCYWAGFIAADGCISERKDKNHLTINLQESDIVHLENFLKHLDAKNIKILRRESTDGTGSGIKHKYVSVVIYKDKLCRGLENKFGIKPRKTLELVFPLDLPCALIDDYIRGFIDGDGCLSFYRDKGKTFRFSVSMLSNKTFLESIQMHLGVKGSMTARGGDKYSLSFCNSKSIEIAKKLYFPEDKFCLERKRDKLIMFFANRTEDRVVRKLGSNEISEKLKEQVAKIYDMLIIKGQTYNNSALMTKGLMGFDAYRRILVAIEHKMIRLASNLEHPSEDTILDLACYYVLLGVARDMRDKNEEYNPFENQNGK